MEQPTVPLSTQLISPAGRVVRPWRDEDAEFVVAAFDDPSMDAQRPGPLTTPDEALDWIEGHTCRWVDGESFSWVVESDGQPAGSVTVSAVEHRHNSGWVSYWVAPGARGQGVAIDGLRAVSQWGFDELGLFRLELGHRVNNPASCRVATGAGYRSEGIERQKLRYGDERFDVELHARLATDPVDW